MATKKQTVGSVVIYSSVEAGPYHAASPLENVPAMITKVKGGDRVRLLVFYSAGLYTYDDVPYSEEYQSGHWSWLKE